MSLWDAKVNAQRSEKLSDLLRAARAHEREGRDVPEWMREELARLLEHFLDLYGD